MEVEFVPGRVWLGKISDFISRACAENNYEAVPLDLPYVTWHESSSHSAKWPGSKPCGQVAKLSPVCPPGSGSPSFSLLLCALGGLPPPSAGIRLPRPLVSGWFSQWEDWAGLRARVGPHASAVGPGFWQWTSLMVPALLVPLLISFSSGHNCAVAVRLLRPVWLSSTPWTVAH